MTDSQDRPGEGRRHEITVHATQEVRVVELSLKGRSALRRKFAEAKYAFDLHRDTGRWRYVERFIGRRHNRYSERITDDAGLVVRDVDKPLSEHQGHGSDHSKPKAHP